MTIEAAALLVGAYTIRRSSAPNDPIPEEDLTTLPVSAGALFTGQLHLHGFGGVRLDIAFMAPTSSQTPLRMIEQLTYMWDGPLFNSFPLRCVICGTAAMETGCTRP